MRSYKEHTSDDADEASDWRYECAACMALRQNTTEREAMSEILRTSVSFRASRKRNAEFKEALQTQVELMPALSETKQGMKKITQMRTSRRCGCRSWRQ